jgi:predicted anti-sigma-YlaC factor YlaD
MRAALGSMRGLLVAFVLLSGGCIKQLALTSLADSMSDAGGTVYARDNDPQLVRDSLPMVIKVMEQIHDGLPRHQGLLVALARTTTSYGVAFVQEDADRLEEKDVQAAKLLRARAKRLFLRARAWGLAALDLSVPGLAHALTDGKPEERAPLLARTSKADVEALYWTGAAWASAIVSAKDDLKLVGELPQVEELERRALALDESADEGAVHEFFVSYEGARSVAEGGGPEKARKHLDRALELSHGKKLSPLVSFAEAVDVSAQNKKEFTQLLGRVLAYDVDADLDHRLVNTLAQQRARWLLSRTNDLFAD